MDRDDKHQYAKPITPGTSLSGVCAVLIIVFFFMPWFSACNVQISAFDLANGSNELGSSFWLYGILLVAVIVLGIVIRNFSQPLVSIARRARYIWGMAFYPLLAVVGLYLQLRVAKPELVLDLRSLIQFEFGFYGTLTATIVMMVGAGLDWIAVKSSAQPRLVPRETYSPSNSPPQPLSPIQSQPPPNMISRPRAWLQGQAGGFTEAVEIVQDEIRIGNKPECEVYLREPGTAGINLLIRYAHGRYYLQSQAEHPRALLNGLDTNASVLQDGDLITIGRTLLKFRRQH